MDGSTFMQQRFYVHAWMSLATTVCLQERTIERRMEGRKKGRN